jgi:hypothetical protein
VHQPWSGWSAERSYQDLVTDCQAMLPSAVRWGLSAFHAGHPAAHIQRDVAINVTHQPVMGIRITTCAAGKRVTWPKALFPIKRGVEARKGGTVECVRSGLC